MLILGIRTDKPEAEIGLFDGDTKLAYEIWPAHRELSDTIHRKIGDMLQGKHKKLEEVQGIVCFQGPGSFTGLRIGLTVANALAYSLSVPIVAAMGDTWITHGTGRLHAGEDDKLALPHYGAPVHITLPKR